jgi:hypothetical protein
MYLENHFYLTTSQDPPVLKVNLILCTFKPAEDVDRNFCFQVISPKMCVALCYQLTYRSQNC